MNKRRWSVAVLLIISLTWLLAGLAPVSGQGNPDAIQILQNEATVDYPDTINFELTVESNTAPIASIRFFWRAGFTDYFHVRSFDEGASSGNTSTVSWALRTPSFELPSIPPFARITYRWEIRDQDGNRYTTEDMTIEFADSTHDWQEINGANVRLLWYDLDDDAVKGFLNVADSAYVRLAAYFGVEPDLQPIVLLYTDQQSFVEFQGFMVNVDSIIGRFYPGHNLTANLITHDTLENYATIEHELSHLFSDSFYTDLSDESSTRIPLWLEEGLATFNEDADRLDELERVQAAAARDNLVPFIELPEGIRHPDIHVANLSYAEGATVFQFIEAIWGSSALPRFLDAFRETDNVNDVTSQIFGLTMAEFEIEWRAWLGYPVDSVPELATPPPTLDPFSIPTPTPWSPPG